MNTSFSFRFTCLNICLNTILILFPTDLHRTQILRNRPRQAQGVGELGDKQSRNSSLKQSVCLHFNAVLSGHSDPTFPPQENLRQYVDRIFNVITTSGVRCPTVMCDIFFSLRESAATRFQGKPTS